MTRNSKQIPKYMWELEVEIKLHINKRLYELGLITEEMYTRAKEIILKGLTTASA